MVWAPQLYAVFCFLSWILIIAFMFLISLSQINKPKEIKIGEQPSVSLYVPCKNSSENFEESIKAIISQEYPDLQIYFIVGSEKDSAYPVLLKTAKRNILVAGKADKCSQKNHNLLHGIKNSRKSDIYAFFDSDAYFEKDTVAKLVKSVSSAERTVATSFPKRQSANKNLAETAYHFYYGIQHVLCSSFKAVWGGCYALLREDFERLGIAELWSNKVSDDIPLTKALIDKKFNVKFLKDIRIIDRNSQQKVNSVSSWMQRQTLMLKHYIRSYWIYSILFTLSVVIFNLAIVVVTVIDFSFLKLIMDLLIVLAVVFTLHMANRILTKEAGFIDDLKFFIPSFFIIIASILSTLFMNDVKWGDYRYKLYRGVVKSVEGII